MTNQSCPSSNQNNRRSSFGRPLVSIGMPVYNGERFVRQALESFLVQDYGNFELIIRITLPPIRQATFVRGTRGFGTCGMRPILVLVRTTSAFSKWRGATILNGPLMTMNVCQPS